MLMDLETALADPTLDLLAPPGALTEIHKRARTVRRRRRVTLALVAAAATALAVPIAVSRSGGSPSANLYADTSPTPTPTRGPVAQQLQTFCVLSPGGTWSGPTDLIGPTGDPIDNCRRFWQHVRHAPAPGLIAYQDRYGQVFVQAKDEPLPLDAKVLPEGARQDDEAIELMEALGDPIELGTDHCRDKATAVADAQRVISSLGFKNWPVQPEEDSTQDSTQCWGSAPNLRLHVVRVGPTGSDFEYPVALEELARPLRRSLTECWSRSRALSEVQAALAASSLSAEGKAYAEIREVTVPGSRCTTIRIGGGGNVQLTLRGPA